MIRFPDDDFVAGLEIYCVGGAVRDELLGIPCKDRDWVVVGTSADNMAARGFRSVGRDFPVFLHPHTHEEYALARTERKSGRGYTGFVVHAAPTVTLEEDLARRDLTINAMAQGADGTLIDPFGGCDDCRSGRLRHVGEAFIEDPLRILRAARFYARFRPRGFEVAESTLSLMKRMVAAGEVEALVAERVWAESERALSERDPAAFFELLARCGALSVLMPSLAPSLEAGGRRMVRSDEPIARFSLLMADIAPEALATLCDALRVPNAFREQALMVVHSRAALGASPSADQVLAWSRTMDAWRRQARLEAVLETLALGDFGLPIRRLERAVAAAREVSPQTLIAEGYRGAALGEKIESERYRLIRQALAQA